jgi:release factor glutamine methyltransferase
MSRTGRASSTWSLGAIRLPDASVGRLLRDAAQVLRLSGSETPRLDAELLLGHVLGAERTELLAEPGRALSAAQAEGFAALLDRRAAGEPVAYIRGRKEFYGRDFLVDQRVLIPRPESELLVELALDRIETALGRRRPGSPPLLVWDVGTGSGAIGVSLAAESRQRGWLASLRFLATDFSDQAIEVARSNAARHGLIKAIDFAVADLLALATPEPAWLIIGNLPYIPTEVVPRLPIAAHFEPDQAFDGGADGLDIVRRLFGQLPDRLTSEGRALLEIGDDQGAAVRAAAAQFLPGWHVDVEPDLAGQARVAEVYR